MISGKFLPVVSLVRELIYECDSFFFSTARSIVWEVRLQYYSMYKWIPVLDRRQDNQKYMSIKSIFPYSRVRLHTVVLISVSVNLIPILKVLHPSLTDNMNTIYFQTF